MIPKPKIQLGDLAETDTDLGPALKLLVMNWLGPENQNPYD